MIGGTVRGERIGAFPAFGNADRIGVGGVKSEIVKLAAGLGGGRRHVRGEQVGHPRGVAGGGLDMAHY